MDIERRNNDHKVKKIDAIRIVESRERCSPQKKWIEVIGKDMRLREVDKNIVGNSKGRREIIRVVDLTWMVWKQR